MGETSKVADAETTGQCTGFTDVAYYRKATTRREYKNIHSITYAWAGPQTAKRCISDLVDHRCIVGLVSPASDSWVRPVVTINSIETQESE